MGKRWRRYAVGKYHLGQLNGRAVVRWQDGGKRQRRILGDPGSEVEARTLLDRFVSNVSAIRAKEQRTVGTVFEAYRDDRAKDGKLIANIDYHWRALAPRFAALPISAVDANICRDYTKARITDGVKQGTVWSELTILRAALNWAEKRRVIERAPYVWTPQKPPARSKVLTEAEVSKLIDACVEPHIRLFVILAITTAARSAAILELTWGRIDFDCGSIDLRVDEPANPLLKTVRKGRAIVPMADFARAELLEAKAGALSDFVIEWNGERVKKIRKGFERSCQRAGLEGVTPHDLRRTSATWLDEADVHMERIAKHLGHSNPAVTRKVYARGSVDVLRPGAAVIDMKLARRK